jgi:hypothetical protein
MGQAAIFNNCNSGGLQLSTGLRKVGDPKSWMGFARWPKIGFDSEVEFDVGATKPAAAAGLQRRWLGNFVKAKDCAIKPTRLGFLLGRHCQLDVVKCDKLHNRSTTE